LYIYTPLERADVISAKQEDPLSLLSAPFFILY
jgi:hypothetical protein